MPATDQSTALVPVRLMPARPRADGRSKAAVRWRTLRAQLIAERTGRADVTADDLTAEARILIEQVCTLTVRYDTLTDEVKRGDATDDGSLARLAVTAERHFSRLDKIKLLRVETRPAEVSRPAPAPVHWTKRVHEVAHDMLMKSRGYVSGGNEVKDLADKLLKNVTLPVCALNVPSNFPDDWLDAFIPALHERPDLLAQLYARPVQGTEMLQVDMRMPAIQLLIREVLP